MADNKEKTQFFIWGMLTGLIIAGSFFILKLDDYFEKLKLYKNITKTFYLNSKKDKDGDEKYVSKTEEDRSSSYDKYKNEEKKSETDKNKRDTEGDVQNSAYSEDSLPDANLNDDEMEAIVIQKDELVASTTLQITDLNPLSSAEKTSDSVIQKVSGIRDDRTVTKKILDVELWKSPLHYKGYKMSRNKLVLYGFASLEGIKIFKLDDNTYIKLTSAIYKLDQTYDYKSYQLVDDQSIINKLK
jgi:hypothetical protein